MNKAQIIAVVAAKTDTSKVKAGEMLDAVVEAIRDGLASGQSVQLIGFGTFAVTKRAAREGRNPRTGVTIKIAAKKVVKFKAGKAMDDAVAGIGTAKSKK